MAWKLALEIIALIGGIATIMALFLGPMFYLGSKIDAFRKEVQDDMKEFRADMNEFRKEVKDFHARLCVLEERSKK